MKKTAVNHNVVDKKLKELSYSQNLKGCKQHVFLQLETQIPVATIQLAIQQRSSSITDMLHYKRQMGIFCGGCGSWTTFARLSLDGSGIQRFFHKLAVR
ncbi:hypothetical protein TNCV_387371 [Trichonephila clavipes]|nr:hypothetical protein TNCV_387371 [Trichonephila clavipes]